MENFIQFFDIQWRTDTLFKEIKKNKVILTSGEGITYKMDMLMPPFTDSKPLIATPELVDEKGFVECYDSYQYLKYKNVFAVGLAVQLKGPQEPKAIRSYRHGFGMTFSQRRRENIAATPYIGQK